MKVQDLSVSEFKGIVTEVVRDVMNKELLKLQLSLIPDIDGKEMKELENELGEPGQYEKQGFENLEL